MANASLHGVLGYLGCLREAPALAGAADAQLLERFARGGEEAPFAALVRRHGPMVWAVARRLLPRAHDAEDVFQATFLLLARNAASVRKAESVGSFLHGVARRLALKLRLQQARRRSRERRAAERKREPGGADWLSEAQAALDAALEELPEKYRAALVLYYLEGKTQDEAARCLGCPLATLRTWVTRGRKILRDRLVNHGLPLSTAGLGALLIASAAPSAAPAALVHAAVKAARAFAAGQPAAALCSEQAAGLVAGALRTTFVGKANAVAACLRESGCRPPTWRDYTGRVRVSTFLPFLPLSNTLTPSAVTLIPLKAGDWNGDRMSCAARPSLYVTWMNSAFFLRTLLVIRLALICRFGEGGDTTGCGGPDPVGVAAVTVQVNVVLPELKPSLAVTMTVYGAALAA
jgi:RNA polymerase sigma factor (sigma-70 family)